MRRRESCELNAANEGTPGLLAADRIPCFELTSMPWVDRPKTHTESFLNLPSHECEDVNRVSVQLWLSTQSASSSGFPLEENHMELGVTWNQPQTK